MEVYFADKALKDVCADERAMRKQFGVVRTKRLQLRLSQLRAAETFADLRLMTSRVHRLTGDRKGLVALDLDGPYRLLVQPLDAELRVFIGDELWEACAALVEEITDYH